MMQIYNSTFETILRLLCLLSLADRHLNAEKIMFMDFIATYGKKYHIADNNLNGENSAIASELAARRQRIRRALNKMIQMGYVIPEQEDVFLYGITDEGKRYADLLNSSYAKAYSDAVKNTLKTYSSYTETQLMALICRKNV